MEQILTLAASLEPGKPTSISNEDILPPGKSRTHRFITCLVLGSFLWSTIVPGGPQRQANIDGRLGLD